MRHDLFGHEIPKEAADSSEEDEQAPDTDRFPLYDPMEGDQSEFHFKPNKH